MIKELRLRNWKSFDAATLFIDPLTVLIGGNASGKSNALDALLFLNRLAWGASLFAAITGDVNIPALRGGIEWVCRKPESRFSLSVVVDGENENRDYEYDLTVQVAPTKAEVFSEALTLLEYGTPNTSPRKTPLFQAERDALDTPEIPVNYRAGAQERRTRSDADSSRIVLSHPETTSNSAKEIQDGARKVLSQLQRIFIFDPVPGRMRAYSPLSENLLSDGSNIAGVLAGLKPERKESVEEALTGYLCPLPERDVRRVWTERVGKFRNDAMLYCEEAWGEQPGREIDARSMSDGTLRYLAIVAALLTREPESLLVIEEVDGGLHPSRAHLLVDMLRTLGRERSIDVLMTTHNPALLDAFGVPMAPFVVVAHRDDATGCSRLTQLEDIEQLPKLLAGGSLGLLSSLELALPWKS